MLLKKLMIILKIIQKGIGSKGRCMVGVGHQ